MRKVHFLFVFFILLFASCKTYYVGTNPAAMLKNQPQAEGMTLTESLDSALNGLLYFLDFKNDYQLDRMLKADVRGLGDFKTYVGTKILSTGKVLANLKKLKTGCTAFVCQSPSGDVLYARNFDYTADGPAPVVMAQTFPKDGYKSVSLISMSLLKYPKGSLSDGQTDVSLLAAAPYLLMDGMNEKGLAVSVLYLDPSDTTTGVWYGGTEQYDRHKHDIMTTIAMRLVLDRAANTNEAIALLQQYNMFANGKKPTGSYHFLFGDKTGKALVLEYVPQNGEWIMDTINVGLVTNFYLADSLWGIGHGHERFETARDYLQEKQWILAEEEAMAVLQNVSQEPTMRKTSNTQWSVVYNLTKGTYMLCVGRDYENAVRGKINNR